MRKHRDLIAVLKSNQMRITPARRLLVQYVLDNQSRQLSLNEIQDFMVKHMAGIDRSSIYRNIETLKSLDIIQELKVPKIGKRFQYVFDQKVHHYYICKTCGKANRGRASLFDRIEDTLKSVKGFSQANLSVVFYGYCAKCQKGKAVRAPGERRGSTRVGAERSPRRRGAEHG